MARPSLRPGQTGIKSPTMNFLKQSDQKLAKSKRGREYAKNIPELESEEYLEWSLKSDPEFYFKKLLKIVTKGQIIPFEPRKEQKILLNIVRALKIAHLPVRIAILKARRLGFSTAIEALGSQETTTRPFRRAKVVAHLADSANEIFSMTRTFYDELPEPFRPMTRYSSRTELLFENPKDDLRPQDPGLRSKFTVATAGGKGIGRGEEVTFLHLSEAAFFDNASDLTTGLLQTVDDIPDTSIFIESTANGVGNWFHEQYWSHKEGKEELIKALMRDWEDVDKLVSHLESWQGHVGFIPLFFPWHDFADYRLPIYSDTEREHLKETLDEEENELIEQFDLDLEQIKWRRNKIDSLARTAEGIPPVDLFKQEYPSSDREAFLATGRGVFATCLKQLSAMETKSPLKRGRFISETAKFNRGKYKPTFMEHPFGELVIYRAPANGHQYAIGGDTAFADKGRDFSCLEVLDKETLEQAAEWHGKIDPDELGRFSMMLAVLYNNATVAIERNNMGIGSLIALRDTDYPNIYVSKNYAKVDGENPLDRLGWETTSSTKPKAIGDMIEHIRIGKMHFNSEALIGECFTFKTDERGRMGAEEGKHDDRVMAMAVALQAVVDYPFAREIPTLERVMHEEDLKEVLVSDRPAWDEQYGDVLP